MIVLPAVGDRLLAGAAHAEVIFPFEIEQSQVGRSGAGENVLETIPARWSVALHARDDCDTVDTPVA
jgi:hypothetical protein